ncbi:MAG TPA: sigma-70 family RNA polymerase sigma factor [Acidimicrobiales bacterium]|nr:sigma-70 family RNA polymerase sigma factor [Acidimicrobiales bacterium]
MTMQKISSDEESDLVERARRGDERAYEMLIEGHRAELHAHCYRMLASAHDADDAVQDALIRAWRGLAGFESRSSVRTWLFKIATNSSFDLLKKRSRRELPLDRGRPARVGESPGEALLDATWIEPYPDRLIESSEKSPHARYEARESLELAFIAVIQRVPARQRAVFILREVLGYSALETAEVLDMSVAAVNSALQRARSAIAERLPSTSQSQELSRLGDDAVQELARRYSEAIDHADVAAIVALLTDDATWSMPPHPAYYRGRRAIERFHEGDVSQVRWRHRTTSANGQLAVGGYIFDDERQTYVGSVLDVLTLRDGLIEQVTAFFSAPGLGRSEGAGGYVDAVNFADFGLPREIGQ